MRNAAKGSSPLARGLPEDEAAAGPRERIIPARAGFTGRGLGVRCGGEDHPRSRGVYVAAAPYSHCFEDHPRSRGVYSGTATPKNADKGSSPLARGLRINAKTQDARLRIIPARAGFTSDPLDGVAVAEDHPRSRGVYFPPTRPLECPPGSSPLARGLLGPCPGTTPYARIIPARAGFTIRDSAH